MKIFFLINLFVLLVAQTAVTAKEPKTLEWDNLMPPGYVESILEQSLQQTPTESSFFDWDDNSDEAQKAYDELKAKLSTAPIVPELNNQYVRLAGFLVPLDFDFDTETFSEFLLVPYFGACIHTPPPPSNQIVHITSKEALNQEWLDYAVWASGILSTKSKDSIQGFAGYSMQDVSLQEYTEEDE